MTQLEKIAQWWVLVPYGDSCDDDDYRGQGIVNDNELDDVDEERYFRRSDDTGALQTWSTSATTAPLASMNFL